LTARERPKIFDPVGRKGKVLTDYELEIPDHVARYLLRVAVSNIPPSVMETLASMTPEELDVLDRLRVSLEESKAGPPAFLYAFH